MACLAQNTEEVNTIVRLVEAFYHDQEFCIITPYDGQRAAIAEALKHAKLPSEFTDKAESFIYNVDSFQGTHFSSSFLCPIRVAALTYTITSMQVMRNHT